MACINCKTNFEGQFCPSCGEKKDVDRITFTSIIENIFSGFVDMDKGLLFNIKNLTLHPQKTILQYINGKRRQILSPISYAIVIVTVYLFIDSVLPRGVLSDEIKDNYSTLNAKGYSYGSDFGYFIKGKMKFLWMSLILYLSFFTKLFFKKYNFFEHLAINSFVVGHATILAIIVRSVYKYEMLIFNPLVYLYISFLIYKVFKNPKDVFGSKVLGVLIVFLSFFMFIGIPLFLVNYFS